MQNYSSQFEQSTHYYSQFGSSSQSIISNYNHQSIDSLMINSFNSITLPFRLKSDINTELNAVFNQFSSHDFPLAKQFHPLLYQKFFFNICKQQQLQQTNLSIEILQQQCQETIAQIQQLFIKDENGDGSEQNYQLDDSVMKNEKIQMLQSQTNYHLTKRIKDNASTYKLPKIQIIFLHYREFVKYLIQKKFIDAHQISYMEFLIKGLKQFCQDYKKKESFKFYQGEVNKHKKFKEEEDQEGQEKPFKANKKQNKKEKKDGKRGKLFKLFNPEPIELNSSKLPSIKEKPKILLNSSQESIIIDNLSIRVHNLPIQNDEDEKQNNENFNEVQSVNFLSQLNREQSSNNQQANLDILEEQDVEESQYDEQEQQQ